VPKSAGSGRGWDTAQAAAGLASRGSIRTTSLQVCSTAIHILCEATHRDPSCPASEVFHVLVVPVGSLQE
jgi:hypothetical protein